MVTGDIIVLQEGDRVPADGIVLHGVNLMADESLLTGEPVPVRKREWEKEKNPLSRVEKIFRVFSPGR